MLAFFKDAISELKKLQIPSKKEVYITTIIILIAVIIFALVIMFSDFVISNFIKLLFGL